VREIWVVKHAILRFRSARMRAELQLQVSQNEFRVTSVLTKTLRWRSPNGRLMFVIALRLAVTLG